MFLKKVLTFNWFSNFYELLYLYFFFGGTLASHSSCTANFLTVNP